MDFKQFFFNNLLLLIRKHRQMLNRLNIQCVCYNIMKELMTGNHRTKKLSKALNGRWSKSEHDRFVKGYQRFGKNWVQVQKIVKTRTLVQVRSHAQKVFMNSEKNELDLSCDYQNSDFISYQESSFDQGSIQNNLKCEQDSGKEVKRSKQANLREQLAMVVMSLQKQGQSLPTREEEQEMEDKINLPDKATIKSWISQGLQPSQFLLSLAQNEDFFSSGGNFIELCLAHRHIDLNSSTR